MKNEQDPFDASKSTFVAMTTSGLSALGIRCLEGAISLLLVSGPSNASAGDPTELKIVADSLPVRQEENAQVIETTNGMTSIQFGDEETLAYLRGPKAQGVSKISIRYEIGGMSSTLSYTGGKSLADVIAKALKACGKDDKAAPTGPPKVEDTPKAAAPKS
jgi:hypothetical protein